MVEKFNYVKFRAYFIRCMGSDWSFHEDVIRQQWNLLRDGIRDDRLHDITCSYLTGDADRLCHP